MATTTAFYTGLSGLAANSRTIEVVGNNIANANTTAFKSSRVSFSNMFGRTLSIGTPPGDTTGGTNPSQVGFGVRVAGTQRQMGGGAISPTGDGRDLAIDGNGFFMVERGGQVGYTRAGGFRQNSEGDLTTVTGERLLGYSVDSEYNIQRGTLGGISIPIGELTIAEATTLTRFSGNLNAGGSASTRGSEVTLGASEIAGFSLVAGATVPASGSNLLETTSLVVEIEDPAAPGSGTPLFSAGQSLEVRGAQRGGTTLPPSSLQIESTTTVQEIMDFLTRAMGLHDTGGGNPDGGTPGVTLDPATGVMTIVGNTGSANAIRIDASDLRVLSAEGGLVSTPFVPSVVHEADGESVRTAFIVYDSLGAPVQVEVMFALESKGDLGTRWRYYVDSRDGAGGDVRVATGTVDFDTNGRLLTTAPIGVTVDRSGTGAAPALSFEIDLQDEAGEVTALSGSGSAVAAVYRDGSPIGTLADFGIGADGVVTGVFTNGLTRPLAQVALATFRNSEGLVDLGNNIYVVGANSGPAVEALPGELGAGVIVSGALELSNVDLGQEFITMILASTGYSASSRVVRTADDLIQQLLLIGR
ncbi:MAG: flagellar hook-basal body complex protein [Phycisphaeraceae bacterium]|nr:flagellar hook-basal body complex protein [Phycisphaeraceae bacterium]MBX3361846.1 flagellar hook-basal body complex protein [Phycisphaeraceae bacterium]MCW5767533.1 flagellar hook-basal body complex protein [Phycisphaeraceae bacterium]